MPYRAHARRRRRQRARRMVEPARMARHAQNTRRLTVIALLATLVVIVLFLSAWDGGQPISGNGGVPASSERLLPTGRPAPLVVAYADSLALWLPIARKALTSIGYHASPDTIALTPEGKQGNEGLFARLYHRIAGGGGGSLTYYRLGGDEGPETGALDVGAAPGVDVYSPVAGTIVEISDYLINGKAFGVRLDIRPNDAPTLIVSITHLRLDKTCKVGQAVVAGANRLGSVIDLSHVEHLALSRYTQDEGNHVTIEARPGTPSLLP